MQRFCQARSRCGLRIQAYGLHDFEDPPGGRPFCLFGHGLLFHSATISVLPRRNVDGCVEPSLVRCARVQPVERPGTGRSSACTAGSRLAHVRPRGCATLPSRHLGPRRRRWRGTAGRSQPKADTGCRHAHDPRLLHARRGVTGFGARLSRPGVFASGRMSVPGHVSSPCPPRCVRDGSILAA